MLFAQSSQQQPLADSLRPQDAAAFIGQQHVLASGMPLANMLAGETPPHSMVLWGPPGCGKTTLARLLAQRANAKWFQLSAVTVGVREVRDVIRAAQEMLAGGDARLRVLFVDEVHHFNKTQQDAFLPHIESGLFVFVGATTENPSFELNNALLSRMVVYHLQPLSQTVLAEILARALVTVERRMTDTAKRRLLQHADGDARRLLNTLERAVGLLSDGDEMDEAVLARALAGGDSRHFDKGGDYFYEQISALHKSIRGSNPDAALYWLCRMLDGGADPRYIGRRLIRIASEDIGLADARALTLAVDADAAYRRLGSPEGELALAEAAVYLACVPKSDAVYRAYGKMRAFIRTDETRPVPPHLQNAPTALMKAEGYGKDYRHAHDETDAYAAGVHYFPAAMEALHYYEPTNRGLEKKIAERLAVLRARDKKA